MAKKKQVKKKGGKVVLIPEIREHLIPFLIHAELNGVILSEYRMAIYSTMDKHQPNLNSATVRSLNTMLQESDVEGSDFSIASFRGIDGVRAWAKAWRKKLGI